MSNLRWTLFNLQNIILRGWVRQILGRDKWKIGLKLNKFVNLSLKHSDTPISPIWLKIPPSNKKIKQKKQIFHPVPQHCTSPSLPPFPKFCLSLEFYYTPYSIMTEVRLAKFRFDIIPLANVKKKKLDSPPPFGARRVKIPDFRLQALRCAGSYSCVCTVPRK